MNPDNIVARSFGQAADAVGPVAEAAIGNPDLAGLRREAVQALGFGAVGQFEIREAARPWIVAHVQSPVRSPVARPAERGSVHQPQRALPELARSAGPIRDDAAGEMAESVLRPAQPSQQRNVGELRDALHLRPRRRLVDIPPGP